MGTVHKTFQQGEILASQDVNDALNPTTADHIPFAVAAGTASIIIQNNQIRGFTDITFPTGRFTKSPIVNITPNTVGGGANGITWFAVNITAEKFTVMAYVAAGAANPQVIPFTASWTAIQMEV